MLDILSGFVAELRAAGVPVSLRESIDAAEALANISLGDREALRSALFSTLVKSPDHIATFHATFDIYFSIRGSEAVADLTGQQDSARSPDAQRELSEDDVELRLDASALSKLVEEAIRSGDSRALERLSRAAVAMHAGFEPARPVGGSYYVHRTILGLGLDAILADLLAGIGTRFEESAGDLTELESGARHLGVLGRSVLSKEYDRNAAELRRLIEVEIRRLLVAERGAEAVTKSMRRPSLDDVDFMHATTEELKAMSRTIHPLARVLAARLARRRRHLRRGPLDFRATIRRSLSTGGVPIEPRFRPPHPSRPEILVLADISGSVAAFARFTVQLVYAISSQFSTVRSIVFIDGADEVTDIFRRASSISQAVQGLASDADVVHGDGHSDYGTALTKIHARVAREVNHRTNVLILGDARNNYHISESWVIKDLQHRAKHVFWLNPEPRAYWGSGDSIVSEYEPYLDGMYECRNLSQLKEFVDKLA